MLPKLILFALISILPVLAQAQGWKGGSDFTRAPFYKRPGSISIHLSNNMFSGRKTATPPLSLVPMVTAARNFTVGPVFTYVQFRQSEFESTYSTKWINPDVKYHEMMAGLRAEYHINALLERIIRRRIPQHYVDVYSGGWMGYSFVKANSAKSDAALVSYNEKLRGGITLGARSLVLKWMGFSLEGGYSSYGYCSFGIFFVTR